MGHLDISIIIVSWNTREILRDCLRSVYEQTEDILFEVIVVDNASSDDSAEMVKTEFPQVILVENAENRGFAVANNQGLRSAQGRHVLLLNPDTLILDGAIQESVKFADQNPTCGVVGIRNDHSDGTLMKNCFEFATVQNLMISLLGLHRVFPRNRFFGRERITWWDYLTVRRVDVVAGCFMLVKRQAIDQVGGMDEAYFMYGEEMDWCWRFQKAGWETMYYPDARIIHYGGMSAAQNPVAMRVESQRSYLRFIEKRQGRGARRIAHSLLFVSGLLRLGFWGLCWIVSSGDAHRISSRKIHQAITTSFRR